ncbi:MAG: hypothetical protein B7Y95_17175 [Rhizobiales bacterium 32-66-11]|nr:MAG: hypothetical protein B7Y95_17175 [Rhizobiales bacterium 32-66-11]
MSEQTIAAGIILEGEEYQLCAGGDGVSFVLRFKTEHMVAYLAGDDAARFQSDFETVRQQFPASKADQALAQLWDQGGYSWLATEEEGRS